MSVARIAQLAQRREHAGAPVLCGTHAPVAGSPAAGEARKDHTPSPRWWKRRTGSPNTEALPTSL